MIQRQAIPWNELSLSVFQFWKDRLLLTAGNFQNGSYNAMTIGWGTLGYLWHLPVVTVGVRPSRYTYRFMEEGDDFTVCAFGPEYGAALTVMGTRSGRDGDKIAAAGLTPCPSLQVAAPSFAEARLVLECRKIYADDLTAACAAQVVRDFYKEREYHRVYAGEILGIYAASDREEIE